MAETKVVLVTGVGGYWGARVAARLVTEPGYQVIGLDLDPPGDRLQGLDTIRADLRNPALAELLRAEGVDTVCHLAFEESTLPGQATFDRNAIGATKLLTACADAGVRKVVLRSSTAVYGARPSNPACLPEGRALRGSRRVGSTRDLLEIETFCSGFRHRVPHMAITILRFAHIVGPAADTPMTRFLRSAWAPSLLGFDPMMQIVHEDDVVAALVHVVAHDLPGVFNVAAPDPLPLSKLRALGGKPFVAVFHPFAYWGARLLAGRGPQLDHWLPIDPDYLRYPCVADLERMGTELGFAPQFTAEEALRQFAGEDRPRQGPPESPPVAESEEQLRALIEQRRRLRDEGASSQSPAAVPAAPASGIGQGGDDD